MRKRFFIGTVLLSMLMGLPMIEPVAAETTPEEATPVTDNRKPHTGNFVRFNGFRHDDGKSVTYPNLSALTTDTPREAGRNRHFDLYGHIAIEEHARIIDYPILSLSEGELTAFQLAMPYDESSVEILGAKTPIDSAGIVYRIIDRELQFRWVCRTAAEIHKGDTLALLKLYLKHKPNTHINRYFQFDPNGLSVTRHEDRTNDWQMALPAVTLYHDAHATADSMTDLAERLAVINGTQEGCGHQGQTAGHDKDETKLKQQGGQASQFEILSVIPNPTKSWADITYSIFGECTIRLRLYSLLGEEVMSIVNSGRQTGLYRHNITVSDVAAGVYILRLETCQEDVTIPSDIMKVIVQN